MEIHWDVIKDIIEVISFISTIGLLVVAIYGLKQLKISKDTAKIAAQRDAVKSANEQVKNYLEVVIPEGNRLFELVEAKKITSFKKSSFELNADSVDVTIKPDTNKFSSDIISIVGEMTHYLNLLEAFSTFFTSKLADENIAFKSVGMTYCKAVERYMPVIATLGGKYYYQNIIELYRLWRERIDENDLKLEKADIEKRLEKKNGKIILPIGTEATD